MIAQHPFSPAARLLAVLAMALAFAFVLAGSAAKPAGADGSQWTRSQPHWWDKSHGWRHNPSQLTRQPHHRRHFNHSRPRVVIGGSGVVFSSPGVIVVSPGLIVRQPGFIVGRPAFVTRQPNVIFERPKFAAKQKQFFKRHPSLQLGQPWRHKTWKHKHWRHPPTGFAPMRHGGVRIIVPGMN